MTVPDLATDREPMRVLGNCTYVITHTAPAAAAATCLPVCRQRRQRPMFVLVQAPEAKFKQLYPGDTNA